MANTVSIVVKANDQATGVLRGIEKEASGLGKAFGDMAKIAGGFVLAQGILKAPGAIGSVIGSASDLNETLSKSNTIFGENAKAIEEWAGGAARSFGQSKQQALEAAGTFGNMFTQIGIGTQSAAVMSQTMTELASDFASFHNADISQVIDAQTAAFRGEYDALQRFVPTINAAAVEQQALAETGKKSAKELTNAEKAAATYTLMLEGAGEALGDFDRTSDGLANRQRMLGAAFSDIKAKIGEGLLPVMTALAGVALEHVLPGIERLAGAATEHLIPALARAGQVFTSEVLPVLRNVADFVTGTLAPALAGFISDDVMPKLEAFAALWRDEIAPAMRELAEKALPPLQAGLEATIGFLADHKEILGGIAIAIGVGLVTAFTAWAVSAGAAAIATIAATAPLLAIGVAIAAVAAGAIWLYQNWDELTARYPALAKAQEIAVTAFNTVRDVLMDKVVPAIQTAVSWFNDHILPAMQKVADFIIDPVIPTLGLFIGKVIEVHATVAEKIALVIGWFLTFRDDIQAHIEQVISKIGDFSEKVVNLAVTIDQRVGDIIGFFSTLKDRVIGFIEPIISKVQSLIDIINRIPSIPSLGDVGGALGDGLGFGDGDEGPRIQPGVGRAQMMLEEAVSQYSTNIAGRDYPVRFTDYGEAFIQTDRGWRREGNLTLDYGGTLGPNTIQQWVEQGKIQITLNVDGQVLASTARADGARMMI